MKDKIVLVGVAVVLSVVLSALLIKPVQTVVQKVVGAASSPAVVGGCIDIDGVVLCTKSTGLNTASTTICSLRSPSATSTLIMATAQSKQGTSTPMIVDIGQSSLFDATTTVINSRMYTGGNQIQSISTTSLTTTGGYIFPPNTWLNVKYGGSGIWGGGTGAANVFTGACKATWQVM